ncbi:auxin transporter-like protein 3 [Cucumis melo var. makuwa]|uniref:Auxin transporter-like protein 3 n=1 Tax=Cucumis melo var. makuwa TaxID=1194695 RepID=A0A5A7U1I1_CUCMM|nr:auxin transporter-like protein 3 [Cucumis melo var. makuwa]TYJ98645.1 auxin transporter-like protein 3 [Cucumis melo var. makuwa]
MASEKVETVAQVLLTLPYSFSQLGMLSGILFQLFYGLMGSWTAYLISVLYVEYRTRKEREKVDFRNHVIQWFEVLDGLLGKHWRNAGLFFNCTFLLFGSVIQLIACASNIYYINDNLDKRTWTYIFGACCATTVFIPSFHNYRIWSFLGLMMTTYTAWYMTVASLIHGQAEGVKHSGPAKMVLYFTGATNILYTFGGHAVTVEIMHAMWKPQKFKLIYLMATLYVLTLTLPSASAVYWAFGDDLLTHSNAFALLPRNGFRDTAVILMLIHQFITFGFACTPLYFVWEKFIGVHETKSLIKRALARLPVVIPIWFLAIIFPFFGPINSTVGSLLVSFTVYIIPALAHMVTFASPSARENAVERAPSLLGGWAGLYSVNIFVEWHYEITLQIVRRGEKRLFSNVNNDRRRPLGRRASSASLNPTSNLGSVEGQATIGGERFSFSYETPSVNSLLRLTVGLRTSCIIPFRRISPWKGGIIC